MKSSKTNIFNNIQGFKQLKSLQSLMLKILIMRNIQMFAVYKIEVFFSYLESSKHYFSLQNWSLQNPEDIIVFNIWRLEKLESLKHLWKLKFQKYIALKSWQHQKIVVIKMCVFEDCSLQKLKPLTNSWIQLLP